MKNLSFSKIWIVVVLLVLVSGGALGWQYLLPNIEVKIPEVGFSREALKKDAAYSYWEWQIYKNEKYNYEIKVPPDWRVYEKKDCTIFTDRTFDNDPYYDYTYFLCVSPANRLSLQSYFEMKNKECLDEARCRIFEEKSIAVDDLEALRVIYGESDNFQIAITFFYIQTLISKDNLIFELTEIYKPDYPYRIMNKALYEIEYIHLKIYETMLSTFRFLE